LYENYTYFGVNLKAAVWQRLYREKKVYGRRVWVGSDTVKKVSDFPVTILNITKLFPTRESLVSDILLGTGKSLTFFYSVVA
jgi:hypothetical protein